MSSTPWYGIDKVRTQAHKDRMRVSALDRYHRLKRDGFCPGCLQPKASGDHVYCDDCRAARRVESKDLRSCGLKL